MTWPFYFTWTGQQKACPIEVDSCDDYHFMNGQNRILDLSSVSYQASYGLKNPVILSALKKQLDQFSITSPKHVHPLKIKVSEQLLKDLGLAGKIFYTVSGAESVENALKMARQLRGANKVLARKACYHGATLAALSVTGDWRNDDHQTLDQWTIRIPDHLEDPQGDQLEGIIQKHGPESIAAFCLETVVGGNGVYRPPEAWYQKVQDLCDKYGIFLILDEVICGFGRTGKPFGFHHYPFLKPDLICLSKSITGGYIPFGAVYTTDTFAKYYDTHTLSAGLTNYAHPLGLASLEGVQTLMQTSEFYAHIKDIEQSLQDFGQTHLAPSFQYRVCGSLMAIEGDHGLTMPMILNEGLYFVIQPGRLILAPALTMPLDLLASALKKVKDLLHAK